MLKVKPQFNKLNKFVHRTEETLMNQSIVITQRIEGISSITNNQNLNNANKQNEQKQRHIIKKQVKHKQNRKEEPIEIYLDQISMVNEISIQPREMKVKQRIQRNTIGGKQNNFMQPYKNSRETLTIKQIRNINNGQNCSDFLFCSEIPFKESPKPKSLSIEELDKLADNFDILFFKNKTTMSKMQRFFTKSDYDHVAMIVKIQGNRYILQSSGNHGVSLSHFSKFILNLKSRPNPENGYELAYRKFSQKITNQHRKKQILEQSEQFIRKTLGKKYKFSPMYLVSNEYKKKQETYFCSQLIVELLKHCGLLKLQKPSYTILPGNLINKYSLQQDREMQIVSDVDNCNQDILKHIYHKIKCIKIKYVN